MDAARSEHTDRLLDPISRISEVLFGLIMALTFTSTLSAATAGHEEARTLIFGAIGCNIAWGLVDAVMFLMNTMAERGHGLMTLKSLHAAPSPADAHRIIASALPPVVGSVLGRDDLERLRQGLTRLTGLEAAPPLTKRDWLGAVAVFLLVFLSTFPVVIPFLVLSDLHVAIRLSNLVAILMLFGAGYWLAKYSGYSPWRTGSSMVLLGLALVAIAVALGG